jgi:hypothetical protein
MRTVRIPLFMSVLVAVLWKARLLAVDGMSLSGLLVCSYAIAWAFVLLLVGFLEEALLRGCAEHTLSRGIGF